MKENGKKYIPRIFFCEAKYIPQMGWALIILLPNNIQFHARTLSLSLRRVVRRRCCMPLQLVPPR